MDDLGYGRMEVITRKFYHWIKEIRRIICTMMNDES
jgi:hypothetical protein